MRTFIDQKELITDGAAADLKITQVDKTPPNYEDGTAINGQFVLPIVDGIEFQIDSDSYVLPIDGDDISSQAFAHLLASFPMYGHIFFNPLITALNLNDSEGGIDFSKTFKDVSNTPPDPPAYFSPRLQTGRESGPEAGNYPTHTALLPLNDKVTAPAPDRPGLMVTKEIDLTPYTGAAGADEFCLYWKLFDFETSEDLAGDYENDAVGENLPAIRRIFETDPEPDDLTVYISPDDGIHWCEAGLLEPVAFMSKTTSIRLAFLNRGNSKIYIANYGILF